MLGLMNLMINWTKSDCFQYTRKSFPCVSMEQLKNGFFKGSQISKLMKDENFPGSMNMDKLVAWFTYLLKL